MTMLLMVVNNTQQHHYTKYEIATTTQNSLDITISGLNCLENSLLIVCWKELAKFTASAELESVNLNSRLS